MITVVLLLDPSFLPSGLGDRELKVVAHEARSAAFTKCFPNQDVGIYEKPNHNL